MNVPHHLDNPDRVDIESILQNKVHKFESFKSLIDWMPNCIIERETDTEIYLHDLKLNRILVINRHMMGMSLIRQDSQGNLIILPIFISFQMQKIILFITIKHNSCVDQRKEENKHKSHVVHLDDR